MKQQNTSEAVQAYKWTDMEEHLSGHEVRHLRGAREKHFDFGGGRRQAVMYADRIHYEVNGGWREIDNNLVRCESGGEVVYRNKASRLMIELPEHAATGPKAMLTHDGHVLTLGVAGECVGSKIKITDGKVLKQAMTLETAQDMREDLTRRMSEVQYGETLLGMTIRYHLVGAKTQVKQQEPHYTLKTLLS